jgi:hypothetical protein
VFAYSAGGWDSIPNEVIFLNRHVYVGFGGRKISFSSNPAFIYFLSSFIHIRVTFENEGVI